MVPAIIVTARGKRGAGRAAIANEVLTPIERTSEANAENGIIAARLPIV